MNSVPAKISELTEDFDISKLKGEKLDALVWLAVFGEIEEKRYARYLIWEMAKLSGVYPASIYELYMAFARNEITQKMTVPAINVREMAYDFAQTIFKTLNKLNCKSIVFEIARSEKAYTNQTSEELTTVLLAAAIKQGYKGPVFVQADHLQVKAAEMGIAKEGELESLKSLILESMKAGFYNIDIDASTLVNLNKSEIKEQQKPNIEYTYELAKFIREHEPKGITVSIGCEIGHIGGKNSTTEDFEAFIQGFLQKFPTDYKKLSKVSVQTGSSHGGTVLPDGTVKKVAIDFDVLRNITKICREKYNMGGSVQHGASTLEDALFDDFPKNDTLEIHLATGFQNIIMDHPSFPKQLLDKMYRYIEQNLESEKDNTWNTKQFNYKLRKKTWGPFKKETWEIDPKIKVQLFEAVETHLQFLLEKLGVVDNAHIVEKYIKPVHIEKKLADFD